MRRFLAGAALAAAGGLLAACGSSGLSYSDGYAAGRSLAAARAGTALSRPQVTAVCERQWKVSGATVDDQATWVRGCVGGFELVQGVLG